MEKLIEGKDYTIVDGVLTVNEGVKHIPESQFSNSENIRKVVFPCTLISIGLNAFSKCCNLIDVNFSNSIEYIHSFAFHGCALSSITLGKNLYYIGYEAFSNNDIFEVINNSTKLRMISPYAFGNNKNLMRFNMNSDAYVFFSIFSGSNHEEKLMNNSRFINYRDCNVCSYKDEDKYTYENGILKINDGVQVIKDFSVFTDCVSVEMPDSVILIDSDAFNGLKKLEHVKFSENLFYIFYSTFQSCSLRTHELILPERLCEIKEYAFASNLGDNKIIVSNNTGYMRTTIPNIYDPFEFREYDDFFNKKKYSLNIYDLLKEDNELLKKLSLTPDNIDFNKALNNKLDKTQSNILKEALINFLSYINYDEEDDIDYVIKLLELKEIDISDIHGAMNMLLNKNQIKTIYLLISYGYEYFNNSMISRAIMNNMNELIDVLLLLGADINEIGTIDMTPLSIACQKGDLKLVERLIEKGAAIKKVDKYNKSAIDYAMENNHQKIIDLISNYNIHDASPAEEDLEKVKLLLLNS